MVTKTKEEFAQNLVDVLHFMDDREKQIECALGKLNSYIIEIRAGQHEKTKNAACLILDESQATFKSHGTKVALESGIMAISIMELSK